MTKTTVDASTGNLIVSGKRVFPIGLFQRGACFRSNGSQASRKALKYSPKVASNRACMKV